MSGYAEWAAGVAESRELTASERDYLDAAEAAREAQEHLLNAIAASRRVANLSAVSGIMHDANGQADRLQKLMGDALDLMGFAREMAVHRLEHPEPHIPGEGGQP